MMFQEFDRIRSFLKEYKEKYPEESARIDRYIRILEEGTARGTEERIVLAIFRSVLMASVDPWDVDLRAFLDAYRKIVESSEDVDFFIASQMILYAANIIYKKSEALVKLEEMFQESPQEERSSEEIMVRIVRREKQRINLMDILKIVENINGILRGELKRSRRHPRRTAESEGEVISFEIEDHIHSEVEDLVKNVKSQICSLDGDTLSFRDFMSRFNMDVLSAFIVILFLVMDGILDLVKKGNNLLLRVHKDGSNKVQEASN